MEVTQEMLNAAMKRAVELRVFPKAGLQDEVAENWDRMKEILKAALETTDQ